MELPELVPLEQYTLTVPVEKSLSKREKLANAKPYVRAMRRQFLEILRMKGWTEVTSDDLMWRAYFSSLDPEKPTVTFVARMKPPNDIGITVFGGPADGMQFEGPVAGNLTLGIVLSLDLYCDCGCDRRAKDESEQPILLDPVPDRLVVQRRGLFVDPDSDEWRWAYVPAEQCDWDDERMHDEDEPHSSQECTVCKLERWLSKMYCLPAQLNSADLRHHLDDIPHPAAYCSACQIGFKPLNSRNKRSPGVS